MTSSAFAAQSDCREILARSREEVSAPAFSARPAEEKWRAYAGLVNCALDERLWSEALDGANSMLALDSSHAYLLRLKISLASIVDGRESEGVGAAEQLAAVAPAELGNLGSRIYFQILRGLDGAENQPLRLRLLRAIFRSNYQPPDPTESLDGLRSKYVEELIDARAKSEAVEQIRFLQHADTIAKFLIDKRYDDLARFPAMPTYSMLAERVSAEVDAAKALVAAHPDRLRARLRYIGALRTAARFDEAERETQLAVEAVSAPDAQQTFVDFGEQAPWIYNERAYALYDVGRNDEARAALIKASEMSENGVPNVSQTINLASTLMSEGRFDEATAAIAHLDENFASPYGRMWAAAVRVCSHAFTGGVAGDDADLAFIRANEQENDSAFAHSMLCIDDADAAAANLIRRLEDPERRAGALSSMQRTLQPPYEPPITAVLHQRRDAIEMREDVRAAVDRVGRILEMPFYSAYWGEY